MLITSVFVLYKVSVKGDKIKKKIKKKEDTPMFWHAKKPCTWQKLNLSGS